MEQMPDVNLSLKRDIIHNCDITSI